MRFFRVIFFLGLIASFFFYSAIVFANQFSEGYAAFEKGDYKKALSLLQPLAKEGNAVAQERLGEIYMKGLGVKQDSIAGLIWLRKSADQWNVSAIIELGRVYEKGDGVQQDYAEAYFWKIISPIEHWRIHEISNHLSPEQKAAVEKRARKWQQDHFVSGSDPIQN